VELSAYRKALWSQFGSAIDMLANAILNCPNNLWTDQSRNPQYWYLGFHTLFFLDLYLSGTEKGFLPPPPFTLSEMDPSGRMPDRVYTKDELTLYLQHCRSKCKAVLQTIDEEGILLECNFGWLKLSRGELLLDTMRHVQHHCAQMNLILRQELDQGSKWISKLSETLE